MRPATYASVNSVEKVCLRLEEQNRFSLFTSNCNTDREFSGRWKSFADTLVLNADNGPSIRILGVTETPASSERATIQLNSPDAQLLRGLTIKTSHETAKPDASGKLTLLHPIDTIYFVMHGMKPALYLPVDKEAAALQVEIRFENLDKPSLVNDQWLVQGRKLRYLPGPGSSRSGEIELQRGKRCFYK